MVAMTPAASDCGLAPRIDEIRPNSTLRTAFLQRAGLDPAVILHSITILRISHGYVSRPVSVDWATGMECVAQKRLSFASRWLAIGTRLVWLAYGSLRDRLSAVQLRQELRKPGCRQSPTRKAKVRTKEGS